MSIILLLIFLSLVVASCFLIAFLWAVKNGQYEDDHTPAMRILLDDIPPENSVIQPGEVEDITPPTKNEKSNLLCQQ